MLGPGYTGRVPESPVWRADEIGSGVVLLEHRDAAAWFDGKQVPSDIVGQARSDFDRILFRDGVAWAAS